MSLQMLLRVYFKGTYGVPLPVPEGGADSSGMTKSRDDGNDYRAPRLACDWIFLVTRISLVSTMVRRTHEQGSSSIKQEKECAEL
jgi:hypothetical protein